MGDIRGFLKVKREKTKYRPVCERLSDYRDVVLAHPDQYSQEQASRCMDCGVPFCHWGCPIGNYIPEWNDSIFLGNWKKAVGLLSATNNFPEITGRLCPALCESACVLSINDDAITIRENELAIIEHAFKEGFIKAHPSLLRTGKRIAIVGSGPAGLACADQLNSAGHKVTVFERDDKIGGILRYGIPDFKLEKWIIDRRINILKEEGIEFVCNMDVGREYDVAKLQKDFDCVCLATGSRQPRDLKIPGRDLKGIYFAMDYLAQVNRRVAGENIMGKDSIDAQGKQVVVVGGGDTGADCVGTALRQGGSCLVQIDILPRPPESRSADFPWPKHPLVLRTSTSHQEGGERRWSILTKNFIGENNQVKGISCVELDSAMEEISGSDFVINADLVIIAAGFLHTEHKELVRDFKLELDKKGNIKTDSHYQTSLKNVFCCGDMHRGQSLIVWAIAEGRQAAYQIDKYLMGRSNLPVL